MKKDSRSLFQNILAIAVPLGLQSMLGFLVNLVDTVMVGKLGTVALAGVSQANQIFFLVAMTVPGIAAGASVLVSQAWGKGDIERIHKVLAYAYRTALAFVVILMSGVVAFPKQVMSIYTPEEETIRIGSEYLRVIVWSYVFLYDYEYYNRCSPFCKDGKYLPVFCDCQPDFKYLRKLSSD